MDRSAGYYPPPPSSKDYKRSYRGGGGKYESDAYDYGSPNMNMSSKQHRLSSDYKGYSRGERPSVRLIHSSSTHLIRRLISSLHLRLKSPTQTTT